MVVLFAQGMPSVTMPGAMVRAMLAAYRRTLQKTMEQARSMQQVVDEAGLAWLETPDQAVVWGTALGLQGEIEDVLQAQPRGRPPAAGDGVVDLLPGLVQHVGRVVVGARAWPRGAAASSSPGRPCPDLGGMMSALGTIGNSPASSGGGGGGGFSGGASGGGGGGSGGGF